MWIDKVVNALDANSKRDNLPKNEIRRADGTIWKCQNSFKALRAKSSIKTSRAGSKQLLQRLYSIEEVINYAFTDPDFAAWLDTQATGPLEAQQEKTLWDTFKELIRKVVGTFGIKNKTLLDDLTDVLNVKLQKGVGALKMEDITSDSPPASPSQIAFDESQKINCISD